MKATLKKILRWTRNKPRTPGLGRPRLTDQKARFALLEFRQLSRALWGGYPTQAKQELFRRVLWHGNADIREKSALLLAQYEASEGNYEDCLNMLSLGTPAREADKALMLETFALSQLGNQVEARPHLRKLQGHITEAELLLLRAMTSRSRRARLGAISRIFSQYGLARLAGGVGLTLDSVDAVEEPVESPRKLSVIVPAYNCSKTLPTALRSILAQTWQNLEVIVADDASTDDTYSVAISFAQRDPRVRVIRHECNGGAYKGRNTGLMAATGEFVTVHDADDWSHPRKFELQVKALEGHPFCTTMGVRITPDLIPIVKASNSSILVENMSSLMGRTEDLQKLGGWDRVKVGADSEFYERLRKFYGAKPHTVLPDVPLTLIRSESQSLTQHKATGLKSIHYGCRREYREAYRAWHESAETLVISGRAPFAAPRLSTGNNIRQYDVAIIMDFSNVEEALLDEVEWYVGNGKTVVLANLQTPETAQHPNTPRVNDLLRNPAIDLAVSGDEVRSDYKIWSDRSVPLDWPEDRPAIWGRITPAGGLARKL